jgi:hypothetical protein
VTIVRPVAVRENGRVRTITKREALFAQLVHEDFGGNLGPIELLFKIPWIEKGAVNLGRSCQLTPEVMDQIALLVRGDLNPHGGSLAELGVDAVSPRFRRWRVDWSKPSRCVVEWRKDSQVLRRFSSLVWWSLTPLPKTVVWKFQQRYWQFEFRPLRREEGIERRGFETAVPIA